VITGAQGFASRYVGWYVAPVSDVELAPLRDQPDGLGTVAVGAKLHNETTQWLEVVQGCATVRDSDGRAIGVAVLYLDGHSIFTIPPGATVDVSAVTYVLGTPATAEIQARGSLQDHPPAP
jgi:hypothetical protein